VIDVSLIRPGVLVKLADGTEGEVKGSFLSTDGLVLRISTGTGQIVDRNVPIERIIEVTQKQEAKG
jgi:hypothetical protein